MNTLEHRVERLEAALKGLVKLVAYLEGCGEQGIEDILVRMNRKQEHDTACGRGLPN